MFNELDIIVLQVNLPEKNYTKEMSELLSQSIIMDKVTKLNFLLFREIQLH